MQHLIIGTVFLRNKLVWPLCKPTLAILHMVINHRNVVAGADKFASTWILTRLVLAYGEVVLFLRWVLVTFLAALEAFSRLRTNHSLLRICSLYRRASTRFKAHSWTDRMLAG